MDQGQEQQKPRERQESADDEMDMPPHFDLIYRVSCYSSMNHTVPVFRGTPTLSAVPNTPSTPGYLSHFVGSDPVLDLQGFMENDSDNIAFVVLRTVECSQRALLRVHGGGSLLYTEDIYLKSKISKNVMQQIATCYFQSFPKTEQTQDISILNTKTVAAFEQNRIARFNLFIFHHRHLLRSFAAKHPDLEQLVNSLLEFANKRTGLQFEAADNFLVRDLITQEHILTLFKPNDILISKTYGEPVAFVLQEWPELSDDGSVKLCCWSFETDGSGLTRKRTHLSIPPLGPGTTMIQDLEVYPLRYAAPELQELIRSRGKKYWILRSTSHVTYKGWNIGRDQFYPEARFMVDHLVYNKYSKASQFEKLPKTYPFDPMPTYLSFQEEPPETSFLLMPPDIYGFHLDKKEWVQLFVDSINPISWNKMAYERLVLPSETKDLISALVTIQTSQSGDKQIIGTAGKRTNITNSKGRGLIMLLDGGPGTGKTLTAESVAEIIEMPLYRVACGDIGTSAEAVEKYVNTVLHLVEAWNCVLLLDELDFLLEKRSMFDSKRNNLASIFLRILDNYDGIIILTSNRVGTFDEAFKSRIQVVLHYESLDQTARKKIWQNLLDILYDDQENVNFNEINLHLDDLAGNDLNGHQICNVLTTARRLSTFRNKQLNWNHLQQALSVSSMTI